jgi:hypothetical protein
MTGSILSYQQEDSIRLQCEIDLKKLLPAPNERDRFNKNWNGLKSDSDVSYSIENAKEGKLIGTLKGMPNIPLLGVPPTRLSGPCSRVLQQLLNKQGHLLSQS